MSDSGACSGVINPDAVAVPGDVVDDIDAHMAAAGEIDRAALLPGVYLAWCVRLQLVSNEFAQRHQAEVLRLNYRETTGAHLLVTVCGGTLKYAHLNARGAEFTRRYYPQFVAAWRQEFGEGIYAVADNWDNYDRIAPVLTKALLGPAGQPGGSSNAASSGQRWWKFWQ